MHMNEILTENKKSWNTVSHHFNGVDALPSYGPFAQSEDELHLFDQIKNKSVLEIGYGSGHSLRYMAEQGACELWGVDLSEEQRLTAESTLNGLNANLFCAPMEDDIGLPKEHFDIVYSIFAIGWTTDLPGTLRLVHSYLKNGGSFIFSWDHPLYPHMQMENGRIYLGSSYQQEGPYTIERFKGEDAPMVLHKRKLSTYINELIKAGFTIEQVIESDVGERFDGTEGEVSDRYYSLYKARQYPTTMIIKAVKM
ncbi:class I SAM-dependent methyltransferase [Falsibacillus pallidus]|uniref:class I SAM-dependent methyltransferase n=1 Tax=Falsibacillus pallidus TaxID=493781 RepID=UPI003D96B88B